MKLILFLAASILSASAFANELPYADDSFGCIDQATAQHYKSDFKIDVTSFGGMELCKASVDTKKLFNDLQILEQGQILNDKQGNLIYGFVPAQNYYSWMKQQTRGISRGNDVPYATAYNRMGYFTMQDGWAKLSTLGRVGTVVHEARHTAGYRHFPCNQGTYAGANLDACDSDYPTGGSHSVEMEYYARVTTMGQNFHPVYKSMARLMAMARANFVFNRPVLTKREAVLAVEKNSGVPVLFDQGRQFDREIPARQGQVKRTSFGAALFDGIQAFAIEMYQNTGLKPEISDAYSYYKLLARMNNGAKDFEEYDTGAKRYVVYIDKNNNIATYNFPAGNWNNSKATGLQIARSATTLENGQKGFFLISQDGSIYPFNAENQSVQSALPQKWNGNTINVATYNNQNLILKADGLIYSQAKDGSEQVWNEAKSTYSNVINVPLYDSFQVQ